MTFEHIPVLYNEVSEALPLQSSHTVIDVTCGGGGHSRAFLEQLGPREGRLLCLDKDASARRACLERLTSPAKARGVEFAVERGDFGRLDEVPALREGLQADLVFADIGVSSPQLDTPERGFSYHASGPLDMRMDQEQTLTAEILVNTASEEELKRILREYGEERYAGRIARRIAERRCRAPFTETADLAETVCAALPARARRDKHPARRTFQAFRIAVNDEIGALERFLDTVLQYVKPGGRLGIITFHSLEDRLVKRRFAAWANPCNCPSHLPCVCGLKPLGELPVRRGLTASPAELERNPRSRSARLRIFKKGEQDG